MKIGDIMKNREKPDELRRRWERVPGVCFPNVDVEQERKPVTAFTAVPDGYVSSKEAARIMGVSMRQAGKVLQPGAFRFVIVRGRCYWDKKQVEHFTFPQLPLTPPEGYCTIDEAVIIGGVCRESVKRLAQRGVIRRCAGQGRNGNMRYFFHLADLKTLRNR